MGTKSKLFRVFVEGETISDGRKVTPEMIDQCVETFNVATYTPRINIEHIAGYSPEPPFNGYGDVVAVAAKDDDFTIAGKTEKRRALYAQVDANDQLVGLAAKDQKPFPSVELTPNYAGTGKIGLVGLAFTDTPASIGTQRLQFARAAVTGTVLAASSNPVAIEFEEKSSDPAKVEGAIAGLFSALAAKISGLKADPVSPTPPPPPANDNAFDPVAFTTQVGAAVSQSIAAALKPVTEAHVALQGDFATIKAKLEQTPDTSFKRAPANGGAGDPVTDC